MENPDLVMQELLGASGSRFEGFRLGDVALSPDRVADILSAQLSDERRQRIEDVLDGRTYDIATVVEGVINTGNVSAVMRTAEGLGFQPFHVITGNVPFKHSRRTTQGAQKWLDVQQWEDPSGCVNALRDNRYQIVVLALTDDAVPLRDIDFNRKTALVLGNEQNGVSEAMLAAADTTCVLPAPGFVQSYNISVAAAMALHAAHAARFAAGSTGGNLSDADRIRLRADFYVRSVRRSEDILQRVLESS
ncbi:MAG: RNA methyltransferase [Bacteroidetes bacterium]|nr:RNA methyltransferase [Bacteroidota bacterium]MDA1333798.1 RNA methyltransferase [Bacteroidota bacterium]